MIGRETVVCCGSVDFEVVRKRTDDDDDDFCVCDCRGSVSGYSQRSLRRTPTRYD